MGESGGGMSKQDMESAFFKRKTTYRRKQKNERTK